MLVLLQFLHSYAGKVQHHYSYIGLLATYSHIHIQIILPMTISELCSD